MVGAWYGNTAAASAASVISMLWDKWTPADDVAVAGVDPGVMGYGPVPATEKLL